MSLHCGVHLLSGQTGHKWIITTQSHVITTQSWRVEGGSSLYAQRWNGIQGTMRSEMRDNKVHPGRLG